MDVDVAVWVRVVRGVTVMSGVRVVEGLDVAVAVAWMVTVTSRGFLR